MKSKTKNSEKATPPNQTKGLGCRLNQIIVSAGLALALFGPISHECAAQAQNTGNFENLPLQTSTVSSKDALAEIGRLNDMFDNAIAKSSVSTAAYQDAIKDASAKFTPEASNHVEAAEMNCLLTCADGLRVFTTNGPKAIAAVKSLTQKGDRIELEWQTRIQTSVNAAKRLAQASNGPVELAEVDLTPTEAAELKEWAVVSDEVKFTENGTRLHVERLEQIMAGVEQDRQKLAEDAASLDNSLRRMQMLQRVVSRFADAAVNEHRLRDTAVDFQKDTQILHDMVSRYDQFTRQGEKSIEPRSGSRSEPAAPELGGPVQ